MNPDKRSQFKFILFLIVLHAVFFFYAYYSGNIYLPNDSKEYLIQATNLRYNHTWYAGNMQQPIDDFFYSRRPPLNGLFIMLLKTIYNSDYIICFMQCILSVLNILLVIKCIRFFYPERKHHFLVAFLLVFFPSQMIYANMIMAEMLFQTLLLLAFYSAIRFFTNNKGSAFFWLNFFLALAVLTKPVLYLFFIPWLIFLFWFFIKNKLKKRLLIFAFIFPAIILIVSYRNYRLTKVFQYSSVHENHVTNYSVRNAIQAAKGKAFADSVIVNVLSKAKERAGYKEYHEYLMQENYKLLFEYKKEFILLSVKGVAGFFLDPGRWDLYSFFYRVPQENPEGVFSYYKKDGVLGVINYLKTFPVVIILYLIMCILVNMYILYFFILFLKNKSILSGLRWFAFILVMYIAIVTGLMGSARYRVAVYPILLFAIPFGIKKSKTGQKIFFI